MKRIKIFKTILIIICILSAFIYTKTEAKTTCTTKEKNNLIQLAHNVKIDYELMPDEGNINRNFALVLSNLVEGIEVRYGFSTYSYDKSGEKPGVIKMSESFAGGKSHKILVYASSNNTCGDQFLITKMITIPKYNTYSEREECVGIEKLNLCQPWYSGTFTEEQFQQQTKKYKENIKIEQQPKEGPSKDKTILDKIVDMYQQNLLVSIVITITLMIIIVIITREIIKNQTKQKIKF